MANIDEAALIEKLRRIEALHAGATTSGERVAAANARHRILARLAEFFTADPPVDFKFSIIDPWSRQSSTRSPGGTASSPSGGGGSISRP